MQRHPLFIRLLAITMTCVVSGLGLIALTTRFAPERWTRFGYTPPLEGRAAGVFGLSIFFFGLLPLMLTVRSPRAALILGTVVGALGILSVFVGLRFLP